MDVSGTASRLPQTPTIDAKRCPAALRATWHTADWWYRALDQRSVGVGADRLTVQVVGIHGEEANLWIQLESTTDSLRCGVLRVVAGTRLAEAVAAIAAILSVAR